MNEIAIEIFGSEAELLSSECGNRGALRLAFTGINEGFVSIDGVVCPVKEGKCIFDTRLISRGVHEPRLIMKGSSVPLPKIVKGRDTVSPAEHSADYVRSISLRERRLEARVGELEAKISEISNAIYRNTVI